jgi:hypothetical protein
VHREGSPVNRTVSAAFGADRRAEWAESTPSGAEGHPSDPARAFPGAEPAWAGLLAGARLTLNENPEADALERSVFAAYLDELAPMVGVNARGGEG